MNENLDTTPDKLQAENATLKGILDEYQQAVTLKNAAQRDLEEKVAAGAALKSFFDLQAEELKYVRSYVNELIQRAEGALQRETALQKELSVSVSTAYQLEEVKSKYNLLQLQLDDLSERLQALTAQNILQQLQLSRIAELESLLENAAHEIELLKNPPAPED